MGKSQTTEKILGRAMRYARRHTYMTPAQVAGMLHISEHELLEYESGVQEIPNIILENIITMGYTLMGARKTQHEYWKVRRIMMRENIPYTDM